MRINGKEIAQDILDNLTKQVTLLKQKHIIPHVAIVLVGDDPASVAYVRQKQLKAESIGAKATVLKYESKITSHELLQIIENLNNDPNIHGIIVQRPLPSHIDGNAINVATSPQKDIDGFHPNTLFSMPLPEAVIKVLQKVYEEVVKETKGTKETNGSKTSVSSGSFVSSSASSYVPSGSSVPSTGDLFLVWLRAKKVVVIGKGETGGGPIIQTLKNLEIQTKLIDSKTPNPQELTKNADIIITTVGRENILTKDMIKQNSIIIGVGMYKGDDGKLHPDYNEEEIASLASFYTPVPGGIGPVNVAMLLVNLVISAEKNIKK